MNRPGLLSVCSVALLAVAWATVPTTRLAGQDKPDAAATERARKTVRTLDDVYKIGIVLITDKYVKGKDDYPAGRAAVKWFSEISKTGSHQVRIIDATGEPSGSANVARDDFEKEGIKQLKAGKAYYDQVIQQDGKTYLRAMTTIPVVMDKCVMCHDNYKAVPKGAPIGALTYKVPVE
jgi:hypothetical protein